MSQLEELETTDSGSVRKKDALSWLESLENPEIPEALEDQLIQSVTPKPQSHSGSAFPTPISQVRVTGRPEFVEQVAKLFQWFNVFESSATRLQINLQQIEDRETEEFTENYALYLSSAVRGKEKVVQQVVMGGNSEEDERLSKALEKAQEETGLVEQ
ncbi:hypothetical protein [Haloferax sp. Q22]|uniref:hypothetical protein n=1 Tax=Haloferax sp. (strain Q22) TaxID=1526048 RepID=UPI000A7FFC7F|nr:hypothetical protein [Haloferax sp. Q22]